jgi:nucleoside-diphosphate-sugar epimerase
VPAAHPSSVAVLGGTGFVGRAVINALVGKGLPVIALSRRSHLQTLSGVEWRVLDQAACAPVMANVWISVAPIWVLPEHFALMARSGVTRIVAISSTSRFTKMDSQDLAEAATARRLQDGEEAVRRWAEDHGIDWIVLRPTLVYGWGQDKNVSSIARTIRRFGFFPLLGKSGGLRQPVHVEDVAAACVQAALTAGVADKAYNISGGEALPYSEMVARIFKSVGRRPITPRVPLAAFELAVAILRLAPQFRNWSSSMASRMNTDMAYDHSEATRDFGFSPRDFVLGGEDTPD